MASSLAAKPPECSSLTYEIHTSFTARNECCGRGYGAMCANLASCCSASSGIRTGAAICELSDNTNCDMYQFAKIWGAYMEDFTKS